MDRRPVEGTRSGAGEPLPATATRRRRKPTEWLYLRGVTIESADEFVRLRFSDDPAEYNRAAHEDAPAAVWDELIESRPEMRKWVVHNKTVPLELLRRLAADPDFDVRCAVAGKRKLDRALFVELAADPAPEVRHRIAWNAKVPLDVLSALTEDAEEWVAEAAQHRMEVLPERKRPRFT
jgi:hypothetical protein